MSLKDIHKKLYQDKVEIERKPVRDEFSPRTEDEGEVSVEKQASLTKKQNEQSKKRFSFLKGKIAIIGGIVLIVLILTGLGFWGFAKYRESLFAPERVLVTITGEEGIKSGEKTVYKIKIENKNKVDLEDASLRVNYSEELTPQENSLFVKKEYNCVEVQIGKINANSNKKYEVVFDVFGAEDKQVFVEGTISYQPSNFNSFFEMKGQTSSIINSSVLDLALVSTQEVASGELMDVRVVVENKSENSFKKMNLKLDYPEGFDFKEGNPAPDVENNTWLIEAMGPRERKEIVIHGVVVGMPSMDKRFSAILSEKQEGGKFIKHAVAEETTRITNSRIQVELLMDKSNQFKPVNADQVLKFKIRFKNTSDEPLRDLVLVEKIASPVIDKGSFVMTKGYYDGDKEQIIWKAGDVSKLKVLNPNEEGEVDFICRVKEKFPIESEQDKNFVIKTQTEIESLDIDSPLGQNKKISSEEFSIKVNSKLVFNITGSYSDGEITNQGPFPPELGQETTLTLRFNLLNTSNELRDVVLTAPFPSGIKWKNNFQPNMTGVEFNERTNELIWKVGAMEVGSGFITPVKNLAFQIGMTPSENHIQIGLYSFRLLNSVKVTAFDTFTNQNIEIHPVGSGKGFKVSQLTDY